MEVRQISPNQPRRRRPVPPFDVLTNPATRLRLEAVCQIVAFSPATIYRKIKGGEFPPPIKVGYASRWKAGDVFDWLKAQEGE